MIVTAVVLWSLVGLCVAFLVYARYIEPNRLQLTRRDVFIDDLPPELDGAVIAHLSDLHIRPETGPLGVARRAIKAVVEARPDLVAITGDICHHSPFLELTCGTVRPLGEALSGRVLAVLGNHDHDHTLEAYHFGLTGPRNDLEGLIGGLEDAGIEVLHNASTSRTVRGQDVAVMGLGDVSCGYDDLELAARCVPGGSLRLVLTHSPDAMDLEGIDWAQLVLCGHAHGGQLSLPGVGTPWAPVWRDRRRASGLFRVAGVLCHVSRGVGAGTEARFMCHPEVVFVTLRRGQAAVRTLPRHVRPDVSSEPLARTG